MVVEIQLTQGYTAVVDDEDAERIAAYHWYLILPKGKPYAMTDIWADGKRTRITMHRMILDVTDGTIDVDHIDGNSLNNARANLRQCSRSVNLHNSKPYKNNQSGYRGVYLDKRTGKWLAGIRINGRSLHLGVFADIEEAARAYEVAAREHYGEALWTRHQTPTK